MKRIIVSLVLALITGLLCGVGFLGWLANQPLSKTPQFRVIYIPHGSSTKTIATLLETQGLIRYRSLFWVFAKVTRKERLIWSGYYNMSPHFNFLEVFRVLTEPTPYSRLIRITIKEGQSLHQIATLLESKGLTNANQFKSYIQQDAKFEFLSTFEWLEKIPTSNLEGFLFPDTYLFPPMASDQLITQTMLRAFHNTIVSFWNVASPNTHLDFYSAVVLASMIEKESGHDSEMPLVSSVFHNRLSIHMPLASDPTVVYALGLDWKSIVYYRDLKIDSPYNTYRVRGLPPTPIASPGLAAFKAAVLPVASSYLFFVAKPGGGGHIFTKTYREHLAVQKG